MPHDPPTQRTYRVLVHVTRSAHSVHNTSLSSINRYILVMVTNCSLWGTN